MKLASKLNWLLLVSIGVVATLFILVYDQVSATLNEKQLKQELSKDLSFIKHAVNAERKWFELKSRRLAQQSQLALLRNSFNQATDSIDKLFSQELALRDSPIETIQLLDRDKNVIVSSDSLGTYRNVLRVPQDFLYRDGIDLKRYDYYSNPEGGHFFLSLSTLNTKADDQSILILLSVFNIESLNSLETTLKEHYGADVFIRFSLVKNDAQIERLPGDIEINDNGQAIYYGDDVNIEMNLPDNLLSSPHEFPLLLIASLSGFVVIYFIVIVLYRRFIVRPVKELIETIKETPRGALILKRNKNKGTELDVLVNSYVELLVQMDEFAAQDHLTGLLNRRSFQEQFERCLHRALSQKHQMALLYIDLDNFKKVNDHYGHATGDRLLKLFSERLEKSVRPTDIMADLGGSELARLAGDEFSILLTELTGPVDARKVAERILRMFEKGFQLDGVTHNVQVSIGVVIAPEDGTTVESLLRNADAAMYQAKMKGKNRVQFFNKEIASNIQRKKYIERVLIKAIHHSHFHLVYMPIFNAQTLAVEGVEVLIRAPTLESKGIGPEEFIPVAESTGLIKDIDAWVLYESFSRLNYVTDKYGFEGFFAINVSAVELLNREYPDLVRGALLKHQIEPSRIELEITETSFVDNLQQSIKQLQQLKNLGVQLSLDDFGTGYTAFSQLIKFPVDKLKIDRSFIQDLTDQASDKKRMVDIVLKLAALYHLSVIAEGVESQSQVDYLRRRGCEYMQGYYLSHPLSWDQFQALLESESTTAE